MNCETDFVAKNDDFRAFAAEVAQIVARDNPADVAALGSAKLAAGRDGRSASRGAGAEDRREHVDAPLRSVARPRASSRRTCTASKIGVLVDVTGGDDALGKDLAMHIAASKPMAVVEGRRVAPTLIEQERAIAAAQAAESGKPANIVEKMVEGAVAKFLAEVTLLGQPFVKDDGKQTVGAAAEGEGRDGERLHALRRRRRHREEEG